MVLFRQCESTVKSGQVSAHKNVHKGFSKIHTLAEGFFSLSILLQTAALFGILLVL